MSGLVLLVAERHVLERHPATTALGERGVLLDRLLLGVEQPKTRSADATPDWSRLIIDATWVSGWVNCREYWMNAWTSPRLMVPLATRRPPSTAITT